MKLKNIILIIVVITVIFTVFSCGKDAGNTAKTFVEKMYKGDEKACVNLMSDLYIDEYYETKKLCINSWKNELDNLIEEYKDEYGDNWKVKVKLIDTIDRSEDYEEYGVQVAEAILEVTHKGKVWFTEKTDTEELSVWLIKENGKWKLFDIY